MNDRLTDLDFADDIALLAENNLQCQQMTQQLKAESAKIGLRINLTKTKILKLGLQPVQPIMIDQVPLEEVHNFTYLGSTMTDSGSIDLDIRSRLGKARATFQRLNKIWKTKNVTLQIKLQLYMSIVVTTAIYACETWKSTKGIAKQLDVFHQRNLRRILGISWRDHVTNQEVLERTNQKPLHQIVAERRWKLAGHIHRLPEDRPAKQALHWKPATGSRKRGRPKITWQSTFNSDLKERNITPVTVPALAQDRVRWRQLAARCQDDRRT